MFRWLRQSLVYKLVALAVLVELSVVAALFFEHSSSVDRFVEEHFRDELIPIRALMNTALAPLLFAENHGAIAQQLDEMLESVSSLTYIVVDDFRDEPVGQVGDVPTQIEENKPSNQHNPLLQGVYHSEFSITMAGEHVGHAHIGLNISSLKNLQQELNNSYLLIAIVGAISSALLVGFFTFAATRHLQHLDKGAKAIAEGHFEERLMINSNDEIGRLANSFNLMAQAVAERRQGLENEKTRLNAIADHTFAWEIWIDQNGRLVWTNPSAERLTGHSPADLLAMRDFPRQLVSNVGGADQSGWRRLLDQDQGNDLECRLQRKDGQECWVSVYWQPIYDERGKNLGKRASFIDVTERRQAKEFLKQSLLDLQVSEARQHDLATTSQRQQARFRALLSAMNLGILFETPDRKVEYVNPAFEEMWGLDDDEKLIGIPIDEVMEHSRHVFARPSNASRYLLSVENTHETSDQFEIHLGDGRIFTQVSYPVHDDETRAIGRLWLYEDVTYERQTAEQLIYLAERDSLTGLYNRHRFQIEMERMVGIAQRYNHSFALVYFDLDEFKYVNDTYGHREGDTVLTRIAGELTQLVRKNDIFARLGGDEFAILTLIDDNPDEVRILAHRIVSAVAQIPFRFQGQSIRMTTSVGISVYPDMATEPDSLVAQADAAMYQAKSQGKNTWSLYDEARDKTETMMAQMTWSQRIEHALENDLFEIHFQGVYQIKTGQLSHLEALVRLRDIDSGDKLFMPGQFIPIAEKSGKILAIDQWVVQKVIKMLSESDDMPSVAVNISGRSFDDPSLPKRINNWLNTANVDPKRLLIELTETAAVSDIQDAQRFIEALHHTGCMVCLDDFGAGFSSFAYLKHITADILKIDGQFIHDLPNNPENQIFLRAMLDVAKGLKKTTVAEFVENRATLDKLSQFGVDLAQGYHLDKPQLNHPSLPKALLPQAPANKV